MLIPDYEAIEAYVGEMNAGEAIHAANILAPFLTSISIILFLKTGMEGFTARTYKSTEYGDHMFITRKVRYWWTSILKPATPSSLLLILQVLF